MNTEEFEILKRTSQIISKAKKHSMTNEDNNDLLPDIIGLKLTNRCNLRCKHCYEWNDKGYHHHMDALDKNMDLDFNLIKKVLKDLSPNVPYIYLWGGEPFVYNKIGDLLELLSKLQPTLAICTNGQKVLPYFDILKTFGCNLELVFALEGFKKENDTIRGVGSYDNVMKCIEYLIKAKREGIFNGKITIHTMISNENINNIVEYVEYMQEIGIDNLILCYPWYISDETSSEMTSYFNENFNWLDNQTKEKQSWTAFKYKISEENYDKVCEKISISKIMILI